MKSNRILQVILVALIVIFVAVGGYIYAADSKEKSQQNELIDSVSKYQAILNKGLTEKATKEKEAANLEKQLADAEALLAKADFRSSAESIEYDRIIFSLANASKLQIMNLNATPSLDVKEGDTTYQQTSFSVTVKGLTPDGIFSAMSDSAAYNYVVIANILDFVNKLATSPDFDTATIQAVNIISPEPMTDEDIQGLIEEIKGMIQEEIADEIEALAEKIETDNEDILTDEEIDKLIETETFKLIEKTLNDKNVDEMRAYLEIVGLDRPSATITVKIWTYEGA